MESSWLQNGFIPGPMMDSSWIHNGFTVASYLMDSESIQSWIRNGCVDSRWIYRGFILDSKCIHV